MTDYENDLRNVLTEELQNSSFTVAAYEGGSKATNTADEYSDLDLVIIGRHSIEDIFITVEQALRKTSEINHIYVVPKTLWAGCYQKFYFLENSPKHFFVDVVVLLEESKDLLQELLQEQRHGRAQVYFDKQDILKPLPEANLEEYRKKHQNRLKEIVAAYPLFKTTVLKEIDRGHKIDAFSFYFSGMLRPLVELMGMIYRPFKYDFGFRYLHKHFPAKEAQMIEDFLYVNSIDDLREKVLKLDKVFLDTVEKLGGESGI